MKKILSLLFVCLVFFPIVSAVDVAYIVENSNSFEDEFVNALTNLGLTYEVIDSDNVRNVNFNNYELILIGDEDFSNYEDIPVYEHKSLIVNSHHFYESGGDAQWGWSVDKSTTSSPTQLEINDALTSTVLDGIPMNFNGYTQSSSYAKGYFLKGRKPIGINLAIHKSVGTIGDSAVAFVYPGTTMLNGEVAQEKSLFFGITNPDLWTVETERVFKNSIRWLMFGEDKDLDHFKDDVDCNDLDSSIYPGASELAYDGIDQDCDGSDLRDVDGDGYDFDGIGGDDCNDLNRDVHPGATELFDNIDNNCVNDPPTLISTIPDLFWREEGNFNFDLRNYFRDADGDAITFGTNGLDSNINTLISNGRMTLSSETDWFGEDDMFFSASDGDLETLSNSVHIVVIGENDAPELSFIENIMVVVGNTIRIFPLANDVEGGILTFFFGSPLDNNGEWNTQAGDEGNYNILVEVRDENGGSDSQSVNINVISKVVINEFVSNGDEWIEFYNTGNQNVDLSDWTIEDNTGNPYSLNGIIPARGFLVIDDFSFSLNNDGDVIILKLNEEEVDRVAYGNYDDGSLNNNPSAPGNEESLGRSPDGSDTDVDNVDFELFEMPTKGLKFDADLTPPTINLILPDENFEFDVSENEFSFEVEDNAEVVSCELVVDGVSIENKNVVLTLGIGNENFITNKVGDGIHDWKVICYDGFNYGESLTRVFSREAPDPPRINLIGDKTIFEGDVLTFSVSASDDEGDEFSIRASNLPQGSSFVANVFTWIPGSEDEGSYSVKFIAEDVTSLKSERIVKITVKDKKLPPSFKDASQCLVKENNIKINIKEPDDGDNFDAGEILGVELEIKNNFEEDMRFEVEAHLYNVDDETSEEKEDDSIKIDKGDEEKIEFKIKIPEDIKDGEEYVIYVFVEDDDGVYCNSDFVEIDVEREDDSLIIDKFDANPLSVVKGDRVYFNLDVQNIGSDDQDVVVEIVNKKLGLELKSNSFQLDEFDDSNDDKKLDFSFEIPDNVVEGDYEIVASAYFSDKVVSKSLILKVSDREMIKQNNRLISFVSNIVLRDRSDNVAIKNGTIKLSSGNFDNNKIKVSNFRVQDVPSESLEGVNFDSSVKEYLNDFSTENALWILNGIFIFGIVAFIIKLIIVLRR